MASDVMLPTWDDLARSEAWYATGRDISYEEAGFVLWNLTCFPFGDIEMVRVQLVAAFQGEPQWCAWCGLGPCECECNVDATGPS